MTRTRIQAAHGGLITAITVQIPFEVRLICFCASIAEPTTRLSVTENGQTGTFIDVESLADQIHILTACNLVLSGTGANLSINGLPCAPMVTHRDGSLVSATNPAKAGEVLVAYALGLGPTNPLAPTGQPVTVPSPTLEVLALDFNYRPNALPTRPLTFNLTGNPPPPVTPLFSGLTPGFVGLYQINFVVPLIPTGTPACMDPNRTPFGFSAFVQSNLTVSFAGFLSFDGAGICVVPSG